VGNIVWVLFSSTDTHLVQSDVKRVYFVSHPGFVGLTFRILIRRGCREIGFVTILRYVGPEMKVLRLFMYRIILGGRYCWPKQADPGFPCDRHIRARLFGTVFDSFLSLVFLKVSCRRLATRQKNTKSPRSASDVTYVPNTLTIVSKPILELYYE